MGRQLGELEQSHNSVQLSLHSSISQLVNAATEISSPQRPSTAPSAGPPTRGSTLSELNQQQPPSPAPGIENRAQPEPTKLERAGSAAGSRPHTPNRPKEFLSRPSSRGLLATSVFGTAEGAQPAEPDPLRYAFQPRRQVVMTPGEQQLVSSSSRSRSRPSSGVPRGSSAASLPVGAKGLSHTKSAAGLLMGTPAASCPR